MFSCLRKTTLASALAILMLMAPVVTIHAQEGHPQEARPAQTATAQEAKPESATQNAESEIKQEAKGSSSEEAVRNSWFVRWLSNKTGLSLDAAYWLCVVFNFAIVFFFLSALLKKKLPAFFKSRTELIQKRIEEARQASEDARRRLVEVEGRLSRLDVEITGMQREAEENARAEDRRVAATVEQERRRIVESA
jgi:F-type H+-transporting ATPase subunit b